MLDVEGPTIETSISASGSARGTQVNENITFVAKPISVGVLHGKGQGVMTAGNSEMATLIGEGIGRLVTNGVKWRGPIFYRTASTGIGGGGKLSFLNNLVGLVDFEVDAEGNLSSKVWEWK